MTIPTHTLTLAWKLPDDDTPIDGTWLIWLETVHGLAIDDAGNGIGGKLHLPTTSGSVTVDLPDTTDPDYSPQNAWYKASFTSSNRRVRVKSEPFVMDGDKTAEDIFTVTALPVTASLAAQAIAAAIAAAEELAGGATGDPSWYRPESDPPPDGWTGAWWVLSEDGEDIIDLRRAA